MYVMPQNILKALWIGKATGWHFNKKGLSVHDMVEKVHTSDKHKREERENMYVYQKF